MGKTCWRKPDPLVFILFVVQKLTYRRRISRVRLLPLGARRGGKSFGHRLMGAITGALLSQSENLWPWCPYRTSQMIPDNFSKRKSALLKSLSGWLINNIYQRPGCWDAAISHHVSGLDSTRCGDFNHNVHQLALGNLVGTLRRNTSKRPIDAIWASHLLPTFRWG